MAISRCYGVGSKASSGASPPRRPLSGLWFGLYNPILSGETVADLYVAGSERFYPVVGDNGWAVGPEWWPEGRYARSPVLADVYRVAYPSSAAAGSESGDQRWLQNDAEYPLCLGYAAFAAQALLGQIEPATILRASRSLGVAVGFDSGDFILIGQLTAEGLSPVEAIPTAPETPVGVVSSLLQSASEDEVWRGLRELARLGAARARSYPSC